MKMKLGIASILVLLLQACFDEDAFDHQVVFSNDHERINLTRVGLEQRTGFFTVDVTEPKQLDKWCVDTECSQTLFTHKGHYFDFSFIADGDWTGDLSTLPKEEVDLMLHTQVRQVNATFYFYQDYKNTNPLLFTVKAMWPDFISGSYGDGTGGGKGIAAYYISTCYCAFISLSLGDYIAQDSSGNEINSELQAGFKFNFWI